MSSIQRAAWAAQVPSTGIIGIIPAKNLPSTPGGTVDIGQVKAAGFLNGDVPVWSAAQQKFLPLPYVPASPTPAVTLTPISVLIVWSGATLRPLESTEVTLNIPAVTVNSRIFIDPPVGQEFVFYSAQVTNAPVVTFKATNLTPSIVALTDQVYQVWVLT